MRTVLTLLAILGSAAAHGGLLRAASVTRVAARPAVSAQSGRQTAVAEKTLTQEFGEWYEQQSATNYLAVAGVSSMLLRGAAASVADATSGSFSPAHTLAFATVGLLWSGFAGATWLRALEGRMGAGKTTGDVAKKAAADYLLFAPVSNSLYLVMIPLLTALFSIPMGCGAEDFCLSGGVSASIDSWQHGFFDSMRLEASMFLPYNLVAFRVIPAALRPQCTAAACAAYTVMLSHMC